MQTLRQMVVNIGKGIAGIQYGARPVPIAGVDLDDVTNVAIEWFSLFFETFTVEANDRETYLLSSSPVLSAVAALGNAVLNTPHHQREEVCARLLASLKEVDWRKGEHWQGIAGRLSPKGVFSVSGTKEVGYSVFNVLADPHNPNYFTVRRSGQAVGDAPTDQRGTPNLAVVAPSPHWGDDSAR